MIKFAKVYTSLCYVGYIKPGSGSVGSIVSILLIYNLMNHLNYLNFIILFALLLFLSKKFIDIYSSSTNSHDSSKIVIDEFLGIFFIMLFYFRNKKNRNTTKKYKYISIRLIMEFNIYSGSKWNYWG